MIVASVDPVQLELDCQADLTVRLVNAGIGPCTDLVFRVRVPGQVGLLRGHTLIKRPQLDAGQSATRVLQVRPWKAGTWKLTSPNFSYQDPQGRATDIDDWSLDLEVVSPDPAPAPDPPSAADPTPGPAGEQAPPGDQGIFICYRREDSDAAAGWLSDILRRHFGADRVFIDVESIEYGVDFHEPIGAAIDHCAVLLAVIGRSWTTAAEDQGQRRRLDDPDDPVRREIEAALARGIRVLPILVNNTPMPRAHDLPGRLAALADRHAFRLRVAQFRRDAALLLEVLDGIVPPRPG